MSIRTALISVMLLGASTSPAIAAGGSGFTFFDDAEGIGYAPPATSRSRAEVAAEARQAQYADVQTLEQGYPTTRSTSDAMQARNWDWSAPKFRMTAGIGRGTVTVFDGQHSSY